MIHVAIIGSLDTIRKPEATRPSATVLDFEIAPEAPSPEPPRPEAAPPSGAPAAAPALRQAPPSAEPDVMSSTPEGPAEAPSTVDLSGITLTNEQGIGWAIHGGNGRARTGVLGPLRGRPVPAQRPRATTDASRSAAEDRDWVAARDLSVQPVPPSLGQRLRRLYPQEARRRAISGSASLRVRIDADGRVRKTARLRESFEGFAEACRQALRGSRWTPPRDRAGRAVATEVRYTCEFVIE